MTSESPTSEPSLQSLAEGEDASHELHRVLSAARGLAACNDLEGAASRAAAAMRELTAADRAYCWFHDSSTGELWQHGRHGAHAEGRADVGLVGVAARTRAVVDVADAGHDPRHVRALDDPGGRGRERLLAVPVIGPDTEVHAVLVAVRRRSAPAFSAAESQRARAFAAAIGHSLHQLALQLELETGAAVPVFRREALVERTRIGHEGGVLRVASRWVTWAYASILAFVAVAVVGVVVARVHHYSSGPAVIRISGRSEVTATMPGTIARVAVAPGDRVEAGAVLVELFDDDADEARLREEFEAALRERMLAGGVVDDDPVLRSLRTELLAATTRTERRIVRAPQAATVGDVRVRPGQAIAPGEIVASLVTDPDELSVLAVLPGADRPMLSRGMPIRLEIQGYPHAYVDLVVDEVADEVVGPAEVRRVLGPVAETLAVAGSSVVVRARVPASGFVADDRVYAYHDGMPALAHVRLRRQRIFEILVPGLDALEVAP